MSDEDEDAFDTFLAVIGKCEQVRLTSSIVRANHGTCERTLIRLLQIHV